MLFLETSAKTAYNVGDSFIKMTTDILSQLKETPQEDPNKKHLHLNKNNEDTLIHKKNECCKL